MNIVYIPVFSDSVCSKTFSLHKGNPGVGGTEFTTIRLVLCLAAARPDWKIILASYSGIDLEDSPANIEQCSFKDVSDFFESLCRNSLSPQEIVIATVGVLKKVSITVLKRIENNLIAWSRHPFDVEAAKLASATSLRGIVCVGVYQFYSNKKLSPHTHHIQNIFIFPKIENLKKPHLADKSSLDIVYLGALIPGKGFLDLAKAWSNIKNKFSNAKLHVIGSAATYGSKIDSKDIPAAPDYVQSILKFIPIEDIQKGDVIFYGNLGEEKFKVIQQCDLAVLNPTGATEAFPASPLECMACGIPVIASDDYGMSDAMRFFPELVIDGHKNIVEKIEWLVADPLRYQEICQRSQTVAMWFASQKDIIITRWLRLLESIFLGKAKSVVLTPTMPFYGSRLNLLIRRDVRPKISALKHQSIRPQKTVSTLLQRSRKTV